MRQRAGITIVELLIAMAILAILLSVLSALFVSTTRAYRVNETISNDQQNIETAVQLLAYELALAGYVGLDGSVTTPFWNASTTLHVTLGADEDEPDVITVRFYEDRFCESGGSLCERTLTFGVNTNNQLTRQEGGGAAQAVAEGVQNLKVEEYMLQGGLSSPTMPTSKDELAGIRLTLTFNYGNNGSKTQRDVAVAFHNPQR